MSNEFLQKACRTCLTLNEKELFDWNSEGFIKRYSYAQCFQEVTQLSLSEDLPQMLCYDCAYELRITHSFIDRAHKADRKLRSYIENRLNNELANSGQEKSALFELPTFELDEINQSSPAVCGQAETDDLLNLTALDQSYGSGSYEEELVLSQPASLNLPYEEENQHQKISLDDMLGGTEMETTFDSTSDIEFIKEEIQNSKEEETNDKEEMTLLEISENNSQAADASKKKRIYCRNYVCKACGAAFKTMSELCRHESTKHNTTPQVAKVKQRKPRTRQPPQQCELCEEILPNKTKLTYHMQVQHGVREWLCHACPRAFKCKSALVKHETIHGKREHKYCCDVCGIKCLSKSNLSGHMKVHDKDRKPEYACDECDKTFYVRSGLVLHKRLHSGDTANCNICQRGFPRPVDLRVHMLTHSKERPFQCDTCSLSFQNITTLKYHKREHAGVQYQCDKCDKVYTNIASFRSHRKYHDEPPLQCQICQKPFYVKYKLKRHIKAVHRINSSEEAEKCVISLNHEKIFRGRRRDFDSEN